MQLAFLFFPPLGTTRNFGDGDTQAALENPTHTYPGPGTYQVCLTTPYGTGCSSSRCDSIVVRVSDKKIDVVPNPVTGSTATVVYRSDLMEPIKIMILTESGVLVKSINEVAATSDNVYTIKVGDLQKGWYIIQITGSRIKDSILFLKL